MIDFSIEYSHIYTNHKIGKEHELSLEILGEYKKRLTESDKSFTLCVLVDDYSFPDPSFDYNAFVAWLTQKGFPPALIFRESQLIPVCDEVLRTLQDKKLKEQLRDYIITKKYPCSLFIAAWYLLRFGVLKHPGFSSEFTAKKLISILPEGFKPFEDKALQIIAASTFSGVEKNIEHAYIEGRLVI